MTNFNWTIESLKIKDGEDLKNIVEGVFWKCHAEEDRNIFCESYGFVEIEFTSESNFTNFEMLTEEQVWAWLKIDKESIEKDLQEMIDKKKTKQTIAQAPWGATNE